MRNWSRVVTNIFAWWAIAGFCALFPLMLLQPTGIVRIVVTVLIVGIPVALIYGLVGIFIEPGTAKKETPSFLDPANPIYWNIILDEENRRRNGWG